ncbi:MAG: hypothetical protein OEZ57_08295 [Nitrospirota bacterium]|nr:hypothetical protein [Nitrospirota bacterium]MDH5774902.1 hypothetical protein [Nitrospirota bacterium]
MTRQEFCDSAQELLGDIEKGSISVELVEGDILQGKVTYRTSNGWSIIVLSDGDDWDYVSSIVPPSKERFELWPEEEKDDSAELRALRSYHPPADQLTKTWGFLT